MATTLSLELTDEEVAILDTVAGELEGDRAQALRHAFNFFLEQYRLDSAEVAELDRQFEAGELISHEEIIARTEAWIASLQEHENAA